MLSSHAALLQLLTLAVLQAGSLAAGAADADDGDFSLM
jgi:hypothetical protein